MAQTKAGGIKAAKANKERYGGDFYKRIGQKGGQNGTTGGFANDSVRARIMGAKGGRASRRSKSVPKNTPTAPMNLLTRLRRRIFPSQAQ